MKKSILQLIFLNKFNVLVMKNTIRILLLTSIVSFVKAEEMAKIYFLEENQMPSSEFDFESIDSGLIVNLPDLINSEDNKTLIIGRQPDACARTSSGQGIEGIDFFIDLKNEEQLLKMKDLFTNNRLAIFMDPNSISMRHYLVSAFGKNSGNDSIRVRKRYICKTNHFGSLETVEEPKSKPWSGTNWVYSHVSYEEFLKFNIWDFDKKSVVRVKDYLINNGLERKDLMYRFQEILN